MMRLRPFAVPYRFVFTDPDTGHAYRADSKKSLYFQIISYRQQNRLPLIDALDLVLENYWCGLVENCGQCHEVKLNRGWRQYLKGGIVLAQNLFYGEKNMCTQEEAERRATICLKCPHNFFPDKEGFVKWSDEIAESMTGERKTLYDKELGNCEVCSCTLKAKVHYNGKVGLSEKERSAMLKVGCWQPDLDAKFKSKGA